MSLEENDVTRFLAAGTHLGANNVNFQMEQYVYKRRQDGECGVQSSGIWKVIFLCIIISHSYLTSHLVQLTQFMQ